ncbi:MAG: DUF3501 family protein [Gammaproteobacteria bacterium]|nr:DUF3501 family protein [Gammaproteobacteria bacterium]MDD9886827.1 DUF3501 family protein [Gammaproteobacteria bacterium]
MSVKKLQRGDLYSLEDYALKRDEFRARVMAHKKDRAVAVGDHVTLYFEDYLTMRYQVQEMLRVEKIFEAREIEEEIASYNPLIPDGGNWKATMMIEYPDPRHRAARLRELVGIDAATWVRVGEHPKVHAISNEDLERTTPDKTSAVHFLRFELSPEMAAAAAAGGAIEAGVTHDNYTASATLSDAQRRSLLADLDI